MDTTTHRTPNVTQSENLGRLLPATLKTRALAVLGLTLAPFSLESARAQDTLTPFTYNKHEEGVWITKCDPDITGTVAIPEKIEGLPVQGLHYKTFEGCSGIASITIPKTITHIRNETFTDCTSLEALHVDPENEHYASRDGVLFNADFTELVRYPAAKKGPYRVPEGVTGIFRHSHDAYWGGDGAFQGCLGLTQVEIPASVEFIGNGAFQRSRNLEAIHVHPDNQRYASIDGVLFDASQTYLIRYPEGRRPSTYAIPHGTSDVQSFWGFSGDCMVGVVFEEGAFENCQHLRTLIVPETMRTLLKNAFSGSPGPLSLIFLGHAPWFRSSSIHLSNTELTIRYVEGKRGFTSPNWNDYPSAPIDPAPFQFYYEPRITEWHWIDHQHLRMAWQSKKNTLYAIETSTDLKAWTPLETRHESQGRRTEVEIAVPPSREPLHFRVKEVLMLHEDFETGAPGWELESRSEETSWAVGTSLHTPPTHPGSQVAGTNLQGEYQPSADTTLRSPVVDLSTILHSARLTFDYFIDTPRLSYDEEPLLGLVRFIDREGDNSDTNGEIPARHTTRLSGRGEGWYTFSLGIPDHLQDGQFQVEFQFRSDARDERGLGWYIDNVEVR